MRTVLSLFLPLLPSSLRRTVARRVLGWDVAPTAFIGRSIISARHVTLGPGSSIGPFNVIRHLDRLELAEGASIGSRNQILGIPAGATVFRHSPDREAALVMGRYSLITVAHEIDCSDRVEIGEYASFAGFRSQILTHSLDLVRDRFMTAPVVVGAHAAVMSGCILQNGTGVPARSILSAGSVVTTKLTQELTFYRGNPAEAVRELPDRLRFFHREGHPGQG
jgi:acetyltransferase-like isoleucine patch superfamily enzyme